jgi:hypothetical protein
MAGSATGTVSGSRVLLTTPDTILIRVAVLVLLEVRMQQNANMFFEYYVFGLQSLFCWKVVCDAENSLRFDKYLSIWLQ